MNVPELLDNTREIVLTPIAEREGAVIAYRRILIAVIRSIRKAVNENVLPSYTSGLLDSALVSDDRGRRRKVTQFTVVNAVASLSVDTALEKVKLLFEDEDRQHLIRVARSIKKGTGLDVAPHLNLNREEIDQLVELYIERNAALIQSLSDDTVNKVEQAVYQAKIDRTNYKDLTKILQKQFGIAKNRADLIAYDQLASINADFTESRHTAIGIKRYRWRAREDGRTRPLHKKLSDERREYEWGKLTDAEGGLPPGKPIRCRCTGVAVLPANPKAVARNEKLREELRLSNIEARRKAAIVEAERRAEKKRNRERNL